MKIRCIQTSMFAVLLLGFCISITTEAPAQSADQVRSEIISAFRAEDHTGVLGGIDSLRAMGEAFPPTLHYVEAVSSAAQQDWDRANQSLRNYFLTADSGNAVYAEAQVLQETVSTQVAALSTAREAELAEALAEFESAFDGHLERREYDQARDALQAAVQDGRVSDASPFYDQISALESAEAASLSRITQAHAEAVPIIRNFVDQYVESGERCDTVNLYSQVGTITELNTAFNIAVVTMRQPGARPLMVPNQNGSDITYMWLQTLQWDPQHVNASISLYSGLELEMGMPVYAAGPAGASPCTAPGTGQLLNAVRSLAAPVPAVYNSDMGYAVALDANNRHVVSWVTEGSSAAIAGLAPGDLVVSASEQSGNAPIQPGSAGSSSKSGNTLGFGAVLTLTVDRAGQRAEIAIPAIGGIGSAQSLADSLPGSADLELARNQIR